MELYGVFHYQEFPVVSGPTGRLESVPTSSTVHFFTKYPTALQRYHQSSFEASDIKRSNPGSKARVVLFKARILDDGMVCNHPEKSNTLLAWNDFNPEENIMERQWTWTPSEIRRLACFLSGVQDDPEKRVPNGVPARLAHHLGVQQDTAKKYLEGILPITPQTKILLSQIADSYLLP